MSIIEGWKENRELLKNNCVGAELELIVRELYVLQHAVLGISTNNTPYRDGISYLLETLSNKISDLAHGRGSGDPLPE